MTIDAEFRESELVGQAILSLKESGFSDNQIEIYSGKPVELAPGVLDRPSRMSLIAVGAGLITGCAVTAFMGYTLLDYPLVTGGMPLGPGWATAVVTFEVGMAGAILATALAFVWESGLLRSQTQPPAPKLRGSEVVVRFECSQAASAPAVESLQRSGAARVEAVGENR